MAEPSAVVTPPPDTVAELRQIVRQASFTGGNETRLLRGGDELFPAMVQAIRAARHEVWLATYIYENQGTVTAVTDALIDAARRGVQIKVVLDGFGSRVNLPSLRTLLEAHGVLMAVFRPIDRWWRWFQPGQLRRLHQKLCVVDGDVAFVGGINLLDDRHDQNHGWTQEPRLDFAVQLRGPIVAQVEQAVSALWTRARITRGFGREMAALARSAEPMARAMRLLRRLRLPKGEGVNGPASALSPVQAAFVLRDNLRRRRAIERSYIDAIAHARSRVDLVSPYFYPGRAFRRVLRRAAARGVKVRLLLQGKIDYRIAALAARALYDELLSSGVEIHEYTPAFLHAKIGVVDDDWATVGSSNIDPLSLLLNLEANVVVRDADFTQALAAQFEQAVAESRQIEPGYSEVSAVRGALRRGLVAWIAHVYLRVAGATGRY